MRRNAFGRQVDSFETDLDVAGLDAVRCTPCSSGPRWSSGSAPSVEVLARVTGTRRGVPAGRVPAGTGAGRAFHPELSGDVAAPLFLESAAIESPVLCVSQEEG